MLSPLSRSISPLGQSYGGVATTPSPICLLTSSAGLLDLMGHPCVNGAVVSAWRDQVGNHDVAFASGPTYLANLVNGRPALQTSGANPGTVTTPIVLAGDYSIFIVAKKSDNSYQGCVLLDEGATGLRFMAVQPGAGTPLVYYNNNTSHHADVSATSWFLAEAHRVSNSVVPEINGDSASASSVPGTWTIDAIMSYAAASLFAWQGCVAEYQIFSPALSMTDRSTVRAAMNAKYAIY